MQGNSSQSLVSLLLHRCFQMFFDINSEAQLLYKRYPSVPLSAVKEQREYGREGCPHTLEE